MLVHATGWLQAAAVTVSVAMAPSGGGVAASCRVAARQATERAGRSAALEQAAVRVQASVLGWAAVRMQSEVREWAAAQELASARLQEAASELERPSHHSNIALL